ncbi:CoA-transferase family III [Xylariaceae sp. FL0662B]|nr:CoA-transferase family III [Xylariaceae sp. FL0662B]
MASHNLEYSDYKPADEAEKILTSLYHRLSRAKGGENALPRVAMQDKHLVTFVDHNRRPYFPIPFKETETTAALKAIEGRMASTIADERYPLKNDRKRKVKIDLEKTTAFLFQTYLTTVDGHGKLSPEAEKYLKDTDLKRAQSDPYRCLAVNMFKTKDGTYYHIHGLLDAIKTLNMIGLPAENETLTEHEDIVACIEEATKKFTAHELDWKSYCNDHAGVKVLKHEEFLKMPYAWKSKRLLPWTVEKLESTTPPVRWEESYGNQPLAGVKVLELCRIIAGPIIGRILAEYGADVLKITSPNLSDFPFFQLDVNMGKHTANLDLSRGNTEGRAEFEELLQEADVVIDGYRPGAIDRLGYGPEKLRELAMARGKGYVYVSATCFGPLDHWKDRAGWRQSADCVSGIAWDQGRFMSPGEAAAEPVAPPFPISAYGCGCMGAIAAMAGLYHRATQGGSWIGRTSMLQYDLLLRRAEGYSEKTQQKIRETVDPAFLRMRYHNTVDEVSRAALASMEKQPGDFFAQPKLYQHWRAAHYDNKIVRAVRPVVEIEEATVAHQRASRPNGSDKATWEFGADHDLALE